MSKLPVTVEQCRVDFETNTEAIVAAVSTEKTCERDDNNNTSRSLSVDPARSDPLPGAEASEAVQEGSRDSQEVVPDSQPDIEVQAEMEFEAEEEQLEVLTPVPAAEREQTVQSSMLANEPDQPSAERGRSWSPHRKPSRDGSPDAQRRRDSRRRSRSPDRHTVKMSSEEMKLYHEFKQTHHQRGRRH